MSIITSAQVQAASSDHGALRPRRRQRAHSGRSRAVVRRDPRTHSPDRSQGAAQTPASVEVAEVKGVYGWSSGLTDLATDLHGSTRIIFGHGFGHALFSRNPFIPESACDPENIAWLFLCASAAARTIVCGEQAFRRVLPVGTGRCLPNSRVAFQPLGFNSLALLASLDFTKVA